MTLKEWRISKGLTQSEVAGLLGIHVQYLSALECGRRVPGMGLAIRIRDELTDGLVTPNDYQYSNLPASVLPCNVQADAGDVALAGRDTQTSATASLVSARSPCSAAPEARGGACVAVGVAATHVAPDPDANRTIERAAA